MKPLEETVALTSNLTFENYYDIVQLLFDLILRCKALGGLTLGGELRRLNPGEIMIKRKDHNILIFARKILTSDERIAKRARVLGLDRV